MAAKQSVYCWLWANYQFALSSESKAYYLLPAHSHAGSCLKFVEVEHSMSSWKSSLLTFQSHGAIPRLALLTDTT